MPDPILRVAFYRSESEAEPVHEWLRTLTPIDRKTIGEDIKTVQFGWPLGMPLVRKMGAGLWETRSNLPGRTARILFTVEGDTMVLLHGFIKKSSRTPPSDLKIAMSRLK